MAVKASASITIAHERNIHSLTRFYKIASSTSTPTVPTENQGKAYINSGTLPSGWSKAEPAYDGTSTNSLFTCDLTGFTDGSVSWSPVSKSSSYEAAKQAYNEAQNAKQTATNYVTDLSNGAFVRADGTPSDPTDVNAKGVRITDQIDIIRNGKAVAKFGETAVIGANDGNQLRLTPDAIAFVIAGQTIAYIAQDKLMTTNAELSGALFVGDYYVRQKSNGKLAVGLRR